jgi:hypothetical protein
MAKKIRLNMEDLSVQSYATGEAGEPRGTVRGHLIYTDPRVCAHTKDWHCTVNDAYCTYPQACYGSDPYPHCSGDLCEIA